MPHTDFTNDDYHHGMINEFTFRQLFAGGDGIELLASSAPFSEWYLMMNHDAPVIRVRDAVKARKMWQRFHRDMDISDPSIARVLTWVFTTGMEQISAADARREAATQGFAPGYIPENQG